MINLGSIKSFARKIKDKQSVSNFPQEVVTKVVGVTFNNRSSLLKLLNKNSVLKLERDRSNEYDCYAVKVKFLLTGIWAHIGFIPKTLSKSVSELMDNGVNLTVKIENFNGFQVNSTEMETKGLNIRIFR